MIGAFTVSTYALTILHISIREAFGEAKALSDMQLYLKLTQHKV